MIKLAGLAAVLGVGAVLIAACSAPAVTVSPVPRSTETSVPTEAPLTSTPTETPKLTETPLVQEIDWNKKGTEECTLIKDFGLEFKDSNECYKIMIDALIGNTEQNGDYLKSLVGKSNPTVDEFIEWLRNHDYWFPFSQDGLTYKIITGTKPQEVGFVDASKIADGVDLQDFGWLIFDKEDWVLYQEDLKPKMVDSLNSGPNGLFPIYAGERFGAVELYGLIISNGRFYFLHGNMSTPPQNADSMLGGGESDEKIVSAEIWSYNQAAKGLLVNDRFHNPGICAVDDPVCTGITAGNIKPEQILVKPK